MLGLGSLGKQSWVCKQLGQKLDGQGAFMGAEWATSHVNIMQVASAKSQSARGASY